GGGTIRPGLMVALVGVSGVVTGLGIPAWQSFVAELVPRESLLNAVTLNSAQFNAARAIGFMLGGLALYSVGPGLAFLVNALSYLAVLAALAAIRARRPAPESATTATFRSALAYVGEHPGLQLAVATCGVVMFLGGPVIQLAPVFARDTFGVDQRAYGFLAAALGIGATAGAVALGAYGDGLRRSTLAVASITGYGLAVLGMALTPSSGGGGLRPPRLRRPPGGPPLTGWRRSTSRWSTPTRRCFRRWLSDSRGWASPEGTPGRRCRRSGRPRRSRTRCAGRCGAGRRRPCRRGR